MHHATARRPRRLRAAGLILTIGGVAVAVGGCGASEEGDGVPVVSIRVQRCARPHSIRGLGVVVSDGLVATAAHTVEGELRHLEVDGEPAEVVALDARTDLALVAAATSAEPIERASGPPPERARLHGPAGPRDVEIVRTGMLVVHDTTAGARHRREVHTFEPGVEAGTSGAPLVTEDGSLLGIVVLDRQGADRADAVTTAELTRLLAAPREPGEGVGCGE